MDIAKAAAFQQLEEEFQARRAGLVDFQLSRANESSYIAVIYGTKFITYGSILHMQSCVACWNSLLELLTLEVFTSYMSGRFSSL